MAIVKIDIKTSLHGATIKIKGLDDSLKDMKKSTSKGSKALKGMWKQMAAGIGVTAGITVAVRAMVNQVKDTIRKGREFEREWANVTTMLTISKEATGKMRDELLRLSPTLGDTTDLAKGMYQVLSASIEPAKAIKFLGEAAKSAKAGVTETKVAVDALTTVINAYGMEAESVTDISDIMFQTVKRGKLTYDEMAASLGTIVPVAATVGIEFKEITAAMATLTRQGIDAQTATMQLRQVLMSIIGPGKEASKMAMQLGLDWSVAGLKAKGLQKFLAEVREKANGNVEALRALVPNVRALTAVMALAGEAADDFAFDLELMNEATGSTDEAFRKQMDSMDFWIKTADVVLDKFKTSFYGGFVTPLKDGITSSDELDTATNELMDTFKELGTLVGTSFKGAFDSLIRNYETTKRTLGLVRIVTEGYFLSIKNNQIPTLRNVLTAWAEYHTELKKNKEVLEHLAKWSTLSNEKMKESTSSVKEFTLSVSGMQERVNAIEFENMIRQSGLLLKKVNQTGEGIVQLGDTTETTALKLAEDIGFMVSKTGVSLDTLLEQTKQYPKGMGDAVDEAIGILAYLGNYVKALAYASAVINTAQAVTKALSAYPPPLSFVMAALQAAAGAVQIAAIAGQSIPGKEKGGMVGLHGPEIIRVGERGPERVIPNNQINNTFGGANITVIQNNYFKNLDQYSIRQSGAMLHAEVVRQKTRFGAK